jgi:lipopolysaccharide export system protein LptA
MSKKIFIQLFLFLVIFFICLYFYKFFFKNNKIKKVSESGINRHVDQISKDESNIMTKLNYSVRDINDNEYTIYADYGKFDKEKIGLILMTNVTGIITSKNKDPIEIFSAEALYDEANYNTNFFNGVIVTYTNHRIVSDKLDLFFDKKIAIVKDNIIYKNLNTKLQADKIKIDLITKNSKIYMDNKTDKVKIKSLN